jgi:DNA-binding CsgD family transcriptional regulator
VDDVVAGCRDALGAARAQAEWSAGGRLDLDRALAYARHDTWSEPGPAPGAPALSEREFEVIRMVADGLTNRQIASRLGVSSRTVDSHLEHVRTKLGVHTRAQIAAWAAAQPPPPGA